MDPVALWKKISSDQKVVMTLDENCLQRQLFEVKPEESNSLTEYLDAIDSIVGNLKACGVTITNGENWLTIINGLPE
jgi:hypothetical protein